VVFGLGQNPSADMKKAFAVLENVFVQQAVFSGPGSD
jgi:hypothetical protein